MYSKHHMHFKYNSSTVHIMYTVCVCYTLCMCMYVMMCVPYYHFGIMILVQYHSKSYKLLITRFGMI